MTRIRVTDYRSFECLSGLPDEVDRLITQMKISGWSEVNTERDENGRIILIILKKEVACS